MVKDIQDQAAERECREETGLDIEITALVGVFSDPAHVIAYAGGEVRQPVNTCFTARVVGGTLTTSDEATEAAWVPPPGSTATTSTRPSCGASPTASSPAPPPGSRQSRDS